MDANETIIKNKKTVRELIEHLNRACQERDEAKGQIHKILNKVDLLPASYATVAGGFSSIGMEPSPTPLLRQLNQANSSITESTSLFYVGSGGGSSPVDSFIDTVSLSDFSTFKVADNSNTNTSNSNLMFAAGLSVVPEYHAAAPEACRNLILDQASLIIDGLSQGKALPQKGRLLEAVMAAGPLLQTLFVAGPLPQWRNPPPTQPLKVVPPVPIEGCDVGDCGMLMNQMVNPSPTHLEMPCGGSNSLLNYTNGHFSGTCLPGMPSLMSAASFNGEVRGSKRLRFH